MIKKYFGWGYFIYSKRNGDTTFFKVAGGQRVVSGKEKNKNEHYCFVGNGAFELSSLIKLCRNGHVAMFKDRRDIVAIAYEKSILKHIKKQAKCEANLTTKLYFAKKFVYAGARNKIAVLRLFKSSLQGADVNNAISKIDNLSRAFTKIKKIESLDNLRGFEGEITHTYFSAFSKSLSDEYGFSGRIKFPPRDPINAALSYLYVRLTSICTEILLNVGLSPKIGYLHETGRNRNSLSLDLVEEFRQPVVDKLVFAMALDSMLDPKGHFITESGRVLLNKRGKKLVNKSFSLVMKEYNSIIEEQANNLKDAIVNNSKYEPYIMRLEEDVSVL